jgi:hypothetical protein
MTPLTRSLMRARTPFRACSLCSPLSVRHLLWLPALNLYTTLVTGPRHIRYR